MREKLKREKGITLIALVVTIVVLLILAGVSISMLTGENGIITQAQNSKEESEIGKEKEMVTLAVSSLRGQGYVNGENMLTSENLQKEMDELVGQDKTLVTGTTILTVLFKETNREYSVNADGEFVEPIDYSTIYTYTEDGYITGLKSEYITNRPPELISKRYASTKNNIKIADVSYWLVEELNGTLEIPDRIEETEIIGIESGAFELINNLKEVIIDYGIKRIEEDAFWYCSELEKVEFPQSLIEINGGAFGYCNINNLTIPFSVQYIAPDAFKYCDNLKSITLEKEEGSLENQPWGANYATISYIGSQKILEFANDYLSNRNEQELEEIILKTELYIGTFEEFLAEEGKTREELKQEASNNSMTYEEYLKSIINQSEWIKIEYQASLLGILDKSVEELELIFVKEMKKIGIEDQIGEFNTFDEFLELQGMTRQEFEESLKTQGFRTEEDYLKECIIKIIYELL